MDEIYAWHEQNFYSDVFDSPYYYAYQAGDYSFVSVVFVERAAEFIFSFSCLRALQP